MRTSGPSSLFARVLFFSCVVLLSASEEASGIKFRMFPNINNKECISEQVPEEQWDLVLDSVEANFRKNANRNLTDREIAARLASFRRPVQIEIGFLTMSPNPTDQTMKPIDYVIMDSKGGMISSRTSVTQEEIDWKGHVGGKGPYSICFTANKQFGVVEVDISYFHINVPEAIGTKYESHSSELSAEDIRDMKPRSTRRNCNILQKRSISLNSRET